MSILRMRVGSSGATMQQALDIAYRVGELKGENDTLREVLEQQLAAEAAYARGFQAGVKAAERPRRWLRPIR